MTSAPTLLSLVCCVRDMAKGRFWDMPIDTGPIPPSESDFDCIVVGGGPGGAAAASYLAMGGKRVLLIEKGVWPRDKVCGDAVGGKSLGHVKALGIKAKLESTPHFRVTGIVFSSPNGKEVTVPLPEEDVERMEAGYSLLGSNLIGWFSKEHQNWFSRIMAPLYKEQLLPKYWIRIIKLQEWKSVSEASVEKREYTPLRGRLAQADINVLLLERLSRKWQMKNW